MATRNQLTGKFTTAAKTLTKQKAHLPWTLLTQQIPYDQNIYSSAFRSGTMPTTVKLYYPVIKAVEMFKGLKQATDPDFLMVSNSASWQTSNGTTVSGKEYFLELVNDDGSGAVYHKKGDEIRISNLENDGTPCPAFEFSAMSEVQLAGVFLVALPEILENDTSGKIRSAMDTLAMFFNDYASWSSDADIPDLPKESAYYLDAVFCYAKDHANWSFAPSSTAALADQVADAIIQSGFRGAELVCSNNNVAFRYAATNGRRDSAGSAMTIGEAKAIFSEYSSHRNWAIEEQRLIPNYEDNVPVMPEAIKLANAFLGTRNAVSPICQAQWCGGTGYGKSTGVRQLACILNMPLLVQTCSTRMDIDDFKSRFVPATEGGLDVDAAKITLPDDAKIAAMHPMLAKAVDHVSKMDRADRETFLDGTDFYQVAWFDAEGAAISLLGEIVELESEELCKLYSDTVKYFAEKPLRLKIAQLQDGSEPEQEKHDNKPAFVHVMANYTRALVNGYLLELQEPSRITDAGVLVGLNEYDKPGAVIHLMNGATALRHKDALVVATDNVDCVSCRDMDQSVLRRFKLKLVSNDLSEQTLKDRVRRNTGCTNETLLDKCYKQWQMVLEYCKTNSITGGSVGPVELETFVQMVLLEGEDSFDENLRCCVVYKASRSEDDHRDILTACSVS